MGGVISITTLLHYRTDTIGSATQLIVSCGLAVVHKESGEGEEDGEGREGVVSNFSRLSPISLIWEPSTTLVNATRY
jgi:hypothetical protein